MKVDKRAITQAVHGARKELDAILDAKGARKELQAGRDVDAAFDVIFGRKRYRLRLVLTVTDLKPKR